ncbi:MAG: DUF3231 family protein [Candidatus Saccharibacteria bacterium]
MPVATKIPITSGELGTLWMTYQANSMIQRMLEYFIEKTDDEAARELLLSYYKDIDFVVSEIKNVFAGEDAVIPVGFADTDVTLETPPLFDNFLPIMFLRMMTKMILGLNSIHYSLAFRKDIRDFFTNTWAINNKAFGAYTDYLLERGVLAQPPHVTMPKTAEFVEEKNYMSGFNPFTDKRALNTIEVGFIFQLLESNIMGMQLMTGFAQVAKESEVRDYFIKGKELAKKVINICNDLLLQSDIQPPSTWAGKATNSTTAPFSDKLMMFCTNFMSNNALGINALGASFSLRSDLPMKIFTILKDTFSYAREGGQIMIKHRWLEEPPQMEDRNQLTKSKK